MPKWIQFDILPRREGFKTDVWIVVSKESGGGIGEIRWSGRWRQYCFFPDAETMYERVCLRDIADFCETQTALHRSGGAS